MIIYAIGDIHGMSDKFAMLRQFIDEQEDADETIILGDLVDRGPDSKGVFDLIRDTDVVIRGNHEELMESWANSLDYGVWLNNGGFDTLNSFGTRNKNELIKMIRSYSWWKRMVDFHQIGRYYFCHAGIDPNVSLKNQNPETLRWIRRKFLISDGPFENDICVVHGHTIFKDGPYHRHHIISLDTGCYDTGKLTAGRIDVENDSVTFFQTGQFGVKEVEPKTKFIS
ncbi:MAG: metallophosphoesterase [Candidimonas sp.]